MTVQIFFAQKNYLTLKSFWVIGFRDMIVWNWKIFKVYRRQLLRIIWFTFALSLRGESECTTFFKQFLSRRARSSRSPSSEKAWFQINWVTIRPSFKKALFRDNWVTIRPRLRRLSLKTTNIRLGRYWIKPSLKTIEAWLSQDWRRQILNTNELWLDKF